MVELEDVEQIRELACNRPSDCKKLLLLLPLPLLPFVVLEGDERNSEGVGDLRKVQEQVLDQESREPKRSVAAVVDVVELLERLGSQERDSGR